MIVKYIKKIVLSATIKFLIPWTKWTKLIEIEGLIS